MYRVAAFFVASGCFLCGLAALGYGVYLWAVASGGCAPPWGAFSTGFLALVASGSVPLYFTFLAEIDEPTRLI